MSPIVDLAVVNSLPKHVEKNNLKQIYEWLEISKLFFK